MIGTYSAKPAFHTIRGQSPHTASTTELILDCLHYLRIYLFPLTYYDARPQYRPERQESGGRKILRAMGQACGWKR